MALGFIRRNERLYGAPSTRRFARCGLNDCRYSPRVASSLPPWRAFRRTIWLRLQIAVKIQVPSRRAENSSVNFGVPRHITAESVPIA